MVSAKVKLIAQLCFTILLCLIGHNVSAVEGGIEDVHNYFDSVVFIRSHFSEKNSFCSGIAIKPRIVVTAAHCFYILAEKASKSDIFEKKDGRLLARSRKIFVSEVYSGLIKRFEDKDRALNSPKYMSYLIGDVAFIVVDKDLPYTRSILDLTDVTGFNSRTKSGLVQQKDLEDYSAVMNGTFYKTDDPLSRLLGKKSTSAREGQPDSTFVGFGPSHCDESNHCSDDLGTRRISRIESGIGLSCGQTRRSDPKYDSFFFCLKGPMNRGDSGGGLFLKSLRGEWILVATLSNGVYNKWCNLPSLFLASGLMFAAQQYVGER